MEAEPSKVSPRLPRSSASISAGRSGPRTCAHVETVYPGLAWNSRATQSLPHRSSLFGASYSYWRVGQYTSFGGYEGVPQGGVYFCGEHTSQDFQGFMEGGASTGTATAKALFPLLK